MKTLMITVGTRQIGWRCQDNIIRCFGTDGIRGEPKHTDDLYQELNIPRENHGDDRFPWSVRDLGKHYYDYCETKLDGDFSKVQLLINGNIIEEQLQQGLSHVILWGSNQPDLVSWQYRRLDTFWLARLMAQKIKQTYPSLGVDLFIPCVDVSQPDSIREVLQKYLVQYIQNNVSNIENADFSLLIENKGASPSIAENLVIYAAGLVRQCPVYLTIPQEPEPFYQLIDNQPSCLPSNSYRTVSMEQYFWPLEKIRIISAWRRGDFNEAKIWLDSHKESHLIVYNLAKSLTFAMNGERNSFINTIGHWINSTLTREIIAEKLRMNWIESLKNINNDSYFKLWEDIFIIESLLMRENYTSAYITFAQVLESYLSLRCHHLKLSQPSFENLINHWCKLSKADQNSVHLLHDLRRRRNRIIHNQESITFESFRSIWRRYKFPVDSITKNRDLINLIIATLQKVCGSAHAPPQTTLTGSLSQWGLSFLEL